MDQFEMLWQYQQADTEADRFEKEIRNSPDRVKLVKSRDYLVEQQEVIKNIENEISSMADRVDMIEAAVKRADEQLKAIQDRFEGNPPQNLEDTRVLLADAKRLMDTISDFEQESKRIRKDASESDQRQHDVRVKAAKVKADFDQLKVKYDAEYKRQLAELDSKRAHVLEKAKGITPEYINKYKSIKLHVVPPMAKLLNDQCGGCNMSLPSVVVRSIKSGSAIVECETCGRMIIQ